ncbi:MAG: hypothetical protein OXI65_03435 [Acidobacteriota bacterium]|nr:hypothetical protein [Acidobacteriota bacterium]
MPRALASLGLVLFLPPGAAAVQPGTAEMTVDFESPARAAVRLRIPPNHPFAGAAGFHVLGRSPDAGWRRTPVSFERASDGAFLFRDHVEADEGGWVHVPVPLPDETPEPGAEPAFTARITAPSGYRIAEAFPALSASAAAGGTLEAHLPAPPSLLRFRLVSEGELAISLTTVVDGLLALLLIGLGAFGARRLLAPSHPTGATPP